MDVPRGGEAMVPRGLLQDGRDLSVQGQLGERSHLEPGVGRSFCQAEVVRPVQTQDEFVSLRHRRKGRKGGPRLEGETAFRVHR